MLKSTKLTIQVKNDCNVTKPQKLTRKIQFGCWPKAVEIANASPIVLDEIERRIT